MRERYLRDSAAAESGPAGAQAVRTRRWFLSLFGKVAAGAAVVVVPPLADAAPVAAEPEYEIKEVALGVKYSKNRKGTGLVWNVDRVGGFMHSDELSATLRKALYR